MNSLSVMKLTLLLPMCSADISRHNDHNILDAILQAWTCWISNLAFQDWQVGEGWDGKLGKMTPKKRPC